MIRYGAMAMMCAGATAMAAGSDSTVTFTAEAPGDLFGWSLGAAGDVNGDGAVDLIFGAPSNDAAAEFAGRSYLFHGPIQGQQMNAASADAIFTAEGFGDNLGVGVAGAGDVNADGFDDVIMGARGNDAAGIQAGRVYLFHGPVAGELDAASADAVISGTPFDELGGDLAGGFDLNGDGVDDIAMGAPRAGGGEVHVLFGPFEGEISTVDADVTISASLPFELLGESVAAADLNGDGADDLVIGGPTTPVDQTPPGRAYVFFGPIEGSFEAAEADLVIEGDGANDALGTSVSTGDVTGDGVTDLAVGADQLFTDAGTGRAYVFEGPLGPGFRFAGSAEVVIVAADFGDVTSGSFGASVACLGDTDGDGAGDLLVGDPGASLEGESPALGQAYLFRGPLAGSLHASDADVMLSHGPEVAFGHSAASVGDLDGDGLADYLIGGPGNSSSEETGGVGVLVLSQGCAADFNGDGVLDVLDFLAFQSAFLDLDPDADCDGNGEFSILDFVCYQSLFQAGCP